jgi:hypothetical protein
MAFNTVFKGTTSGSIASIPLNNSCVIKSFIITSVGVAQFTVYIASNEDGSAVRITAIDTALAEKGKLEVNLDIKVNPNHAILIVTDAEIDYYFTISAE